MIGNIFPNLRKAIYVFAFVATAAAYAEMPAGQSTFERPRPATKYKPSVGLTFGIADTEGSYDSGAGYGIEAGLQPYIPFGAALKLISYASGETRDLPSLTRTELLVKGIYHLSGAIPLVRHSYFGAELGPVWDNVNSESVTNFGFGPLVGFDIPLSDMESRYSLGANADYLFIGGSKADVFAFNATVKYWF